MKKMLPFNGLDDGSVGLFFILTNENPLENLTTLREPEIVYIKGRRIARDKLNELIEKAENRKNLIATAFRYIEYLITER